MLSVAIFLKRLWRYSSYTLGQNCPWWKIPKERLTASAFSACQIAYYKDHT